MGLLMMAFLATCVLRTLPEARDDLCISEELLEAAYKCKVIKDRKLLVDKVYTKSPEEINNMVRDMEFEDEESFWNFVNSISTEWEDLIFAKESKMLSDMLLNANAAYINKIRQRLGNPLCGSEMERELKDLLRISEHLNNAWKDICVTQNELGEGRYSTMLKVENPFIIPGDRFKECYYWDTYWIIEGLLNNGLHDLAIGMVENFIDLIKRYGFIPNGLRMYYLNRSQPPYFPMMLLALYRHVPWLKVEDVIRRGLAAAKIEYEFFMKHRSVVVERDGVAHTLNLYKVETSTPRPESYGKDKALAEKCSRNGGRDAKDLYTDIKSGAESGWDFSSRWMKDKVNFETIRTSKRIPVDLNAIMYSNELIISRLSEVVGGTHTKDVSDFKKNSEKRLRAINAVLWNDEERIWNDYDIEDKVHTSRGFYVSNLIPMCYGISPPHDKNVTVYDILGMFAEEIFGNEGGMPASGAENEKSAHQWDYPNVWPPLVHIMAFFLDRIGEREMALHVARPLIRSISISTSAGSEKGEIFERYSCKKLGEPGHKGGYAPQVGFGWTNGSAIHFISYFLFDIIPSKSHAESYRDIRALIEAKRLSREIPEKHTPENCLLLNGSPTDGTYSSEATQLSECPSFIPVSN